MPGYTGASRERLIMTAAADIPALVGGLKEPLKRLTAEFRRPLYLFDEAIVKTRVFVVW